MTHPNPSLAIPFGVFLTLIAMAPLWFPVWWNRNFGKVTAIFSIVVLGYYFANHSYARVWRTAEEYISFICLIGSLFVVAGGIRINVKGEATPAVNVLFLFIGALTSNFLGTTGASMLLIRPWLRMNKFRLTGHHIVFFIFIVSNVGGCLTPIGDPPLFLGYLVGVPFWWVAEKCWPMWLTGVAILLGIFFVLDVVNFRRAPREIRDRETAREEWRFEGLQNLFFLFVILASVFINHPPFVREGIMAAAALGSYLTTGKKIHDLNEFNFHPIKEVTVLFAGIFSTMMPALDWLQSNGALLGQPSPGIVFWGSGMLSSVLDNAPTYLSFMSTCAGTFAPQELVDAVVSHVRAHGLDTNAITQGPAAASVGQAIGALQTYPPAGLELAKLSPRQAQIALLLGNPLSAKCLIALSVGAVFFGANTYIGNGPNFMVKAIADHRKAHTPTFLGYILRFTLPFMLPTLVIVWWFFLRR
jgi:Na+/H+ antiporter NhaD/arsenite permease-like protein